MALFEKAFTEFGMAMAKGGEAVLGLGGAAWVSAGKVVQKYIAQNPASGSIGGWQTVSALYVTFSGIAVSLTCLFFVIGWCRESIDIRTDFTLENMFRFFIRFILTSQAIVYGLNLIRDFMELIAVLTAGIATPMVEVSSDGVFTGVMDNLEGAECLVPGLLFLLGGIIGAAVVLVCSIKIMLAVFSRFFRIFVIVPFAPVALSTFAGGQGLFQTGSAWIKTFMGYLLEIVVIAIALALSTKIFGSVTFFGTQVSGDQGWGTNTVNVLLSICETVTPVLATTACVTGAESVIRRCLGLNT